MAPPESGSIKIHVFKSLREKMHCHILQVLTEVGVRAVHYKVFERASRPPSEIVRGRAVLGKKILPSTRFPPGKTGSAHAESNVPRLIVKPDR
jgi:hypothetical protein